MLELLREKFMQTVNSCETKLFILSLIFIVCPMSFAIGANNQPVVLYVTVDVGGRAIITSNADGTVYYRDYMTIPVTVDVEGGATIQEVQVFYRTPNSGSFTQSTTKSPQKNIFRSSIKPAPGDPVFNPAGSRYYEGSVIVPGSAYVGQGLEYYFEVVLSNGESFFYGTASAPRAASYNPTYVTIVNASGDEAVLPDGDASDGSNTSVFFPAGSLAQPMQVSIEHVDQNDRGRVSPGSGAALSQVPASAFEINGTVNRFSTPITLSLLYPDIDNVPGQVDGTNIDETLLRMFWWDGFAWRFLGGTVDTQNNMVTARTTHFTLFALFPAANLSPRTFMPMEKIISPNGDGMNDIAYFSGLSGAFEIKIFDMTGRRIRTITDLAQWDGRDENGYLVENGSYVYQYRADLSNDWVSGVIGVAK